MQSISLQPSEQNLAGLHTILAVEYSLAPDKYALGGGSRGRLVFGDPLRQSRQPLRRAHALGRGGCWR